jgi:hypothetical protein
VLGTIVGLVLGVPLGVLTSLTAWWILFHRITPALQFAAYISRRERPGRVYRLKMVNTGKRNVIDCLVVAELRVKGLSPDVPGNTWLIELPLRVSRFAFWPAKTNRLIVFLPYHPDPPIIAFLGKSAGNGFTLDELLLCRDVVRLRVVVFAYDEFSGSRRVFVSSDYTISDIRDGNYVGLAITSAPAVTDNVDEIP